MALFEIDVSRIARWVDEEWGDRLAQRRIRKLREKGRESEARLRATQLELRRVLQEIRKSRSDAHRLARELTECRARVETLRLVADAKIAGVAEASEN